MADSPLADLIAAHDDFVPTKVLVIVAHPDDMEYGAARAVVAFLEGREPAGRVV